MRILTAVICAALLCSCGSAGPLERGAELSAWAVYWDTESAAGEVRAAGGLDALFHFSVLFRPDGHLFTPEETTALFRSLKDGAGAGAIHYLTAVNDVVGEDGSALQKDTGVLIPLLATKESRAAHIAELLTAAGGYDGLEIDYETLHRREGGLAKNFALFAGELWEAAGESGLLLRVVLEPGFPVAEIPLPEGPEYAVMLYNLYGGHSGPGPKADKDFITETVRKTAVLPGDVVYAFATGGFEWRADGSPAGELTELEALALLEKSGGGERDEASGCVVFSYPAEDGEHTVWYADGETLRFWMDTAYAASGHRKFAVWRLGGNSPHSLEALRFP